MEDHHSTAWRSPNYSVRALPVDMVVLHYTGMQSRDAALERLCDPAYQLSAHYLIDEAGTVFAMVDEAARAHHAGVSSWQSITDTNSRSIGIELVNPGHEFGYRVFPMAQVQSLLRLLPGIVRRWRIAPCNIWGHSDVAPRRKEDPGERFPWGTLARQGYGLWPGRGGRMASSRDAQVLLTQLGYEAVTAAQFKAATVAYQRHFRPARLHEGLTLADIQLLRRLVGALPSA